MSKLLKISIFSNALIILLCATSCPDNEPDPCTTKNAELMDGFMAEYGFNDSHKLEEGLYLKITDTTRVDPFVKPKPKSGSSVVVDYISIYGDEGVGEVTIRDKAEALGVYEPDLVYGPIRLDVYRTTEGFSKAIQNVRQGESAIILMSHELAFGNCQPMVYDVHLYKVIDDILAYDSLTYGDYINLFQYDDTLFSDGVKTAYYKVINTGIDSADFEIKLEDSVTINLHAYYVETDPLYVTDYPGREFFPINNSGERYRFVFGDLSFPISNIVSSAISEMNIGSIWEVLSPPDFAYGFSGYHHPLKGIYIVPPNMAVHYRIELIDSRTPGK